jgi:hypothetical protein
LKEGSVVPNYACKVMKGRAVKVWIQKIKNGNLITYVESLLSYVTEQEFINMFQNIFCRMLLDSSLVTRFKPLLSFDVILTVHRR